MKNVLVVFLGKNGGIPKFTYEFVKGLVEAKYNVYCILSKEIYNKPQWDKNTKIKKIVYVYTGDTKSYFITCATMLTITRRIIASEFGSIEFDLSICTMPYLWSKYLAELAGVETKTVICHDPIAHEGTSSIMKFIYKMATKKYDKTIIMTEKFREIMINDYGYSNNQIVYMPHGSYEYANINKREILNGEVVNFLFFGRISQYKGINVLIDAYSLLKEKGLECKLTIAGHGDFSQYQEKLKNLGEVTVINQFIPDEEVPLLFRDKKTVTVLPYIDATQSGVIPVAMQYGSPIIATETGGLKEQLLNGKIGVFCKPNNVDDLAEKMSMFITKKGYLEKQSMEIAQQYPKIKWENILSETIPQLLSLPSEDV